MSTTDDCNYVPLFDCSDDEPAGLFVNKASAGRFVRIGEDCYRAGREAQTAAAANLRTIDKEYTSCEACEGCEVTLVVSQGSGPEPWTSSYFDWNISVTCGGVPVGGGSFSGWGGDPAGNFSFLAPCHCDDLGIEFSGDGSWNRLDIFTITINGTQVFQEEGDVVSFSWPSGGP